MILCCVSSQDEGWVRSQTTEPHRCIHGVSARLPFPAGGKELTWLAVLVTLVTFLAPLFTLLLETLLWGRPAAQPPLWEVPQTPVYGTGSGGGVGKDTAPTIPGVILDWRSPQGALTCAVGL